VDLQLSTRPDGRDAESPAADHLRLLFAPFEGKPACILMKPIDKAGVC
jgi:hypothetical protein